MMMRPNKKWLAVPAVAVCLSVGVAHAVSESISGTLNSNGSVVTFNKIRTVTHSNASIDITLDDTTDGTTNLSLKSTKSGNKFGSTVSCSDKCSRSFATGVKEGTAFVVTGRITDWSWWYDDTDFRGTINW